MNCLTSGFSLGTPAASSLASYVSGAIRPSITWESVLVCTFWREGKDQSKKKTDLAFLPSDFFMIPPCSGDHLGELQLEKENQWHQSLPSIQTWKYLSNANFYEISHQQLGPTKCCQFDRSKSSCLQNWNSWSRDIQKKIIQCCFFYSEPCKILLDLSGVGHCLNATKKRLEVPLAVCLALFKILIWGAFIFIGGENCQDSPGRRMFSPRTPRSYGHQTPCELGNAPSHLKYMNS